MDEADFRPANPRRRRKTKMEIIKEAYLPTVILILTAVLIIIFIVGGLVRRGTKPDPKPSEPSVPSGPTEDPYAGEVQRLLAEAAALAADYDFEAAAARIGTFSGDLSVYTELAAKKAEYLQAASGMISWSDPSQIACLSFHNLIMDESKAFADKSYGSKYNRNFVTVGEFSAILQQLYDNGYILVRPSDYTSCVTDDSGHVTCSAVPLKLPLGKKPLVLIQTNANYYTYMQGAGFASRLCLDENGQLTCAVDGENGTVQTGDFDLVPILNKFIQAHPDFSYRGARAILAPSGYDGVFGYRTNPSVKESKGVEYYNAQVQGAKDVAAALKAEGYELACYTYGNSAYGLVSAPEIQTELRKWEDEVSSILGDTNILVYAQDSELAEYTGTKYDVLQNAGFRYFFGFTKATVDPGYILLKRIPVGGCQMAHTSLLNSFFDPETVLSSLRGEVPN